MSYWKLFKNAGLFIQFFKDIGALISYYSKEKKFSNGLASVVVIDLEKILESGAIDIPGVDENDIAKVIEDVRKRVLT